MTGMLDVSPWAQLWVWIGAGVLFAVALAVLIRRQSRRPGAGSAGNRAVGAAWTGVGFGIFATWMAFMAVGFSTGDWGIMRAMPSVVAAAYGTAWLVAGAMSGLRWQGLIAWASYAGAVVLGLVIDSAAIYLVYAGLLVLVAVLPGLALMRQEPAEVI